MVETSEHGEPLGGSPAEILLVEDNPGDVRLFQEALFDGKLRNVIHHVPNAEEGLAFLRREGRYAQAPRPDIVLLDLNLPGMNGRELLQEVKSNPELCHVPVIVMTSSEAEADILRSYELNANCFVTKPLDIDEFFEALRSIQAFWLDIVSLPRRRTPS